MKVVSPTLLTSHLQPYVQDNTALRQTQILEPTDSADNFVLDPFQVEAIDALKEGFSVVVSAPTGAGKTKIAESIIEEALLTGERVFYTTPVKALSNQKFRDFQRQYGEDNVGLLTGDTTINHGAPITVMTTEIYRNMLYDSSINLSSSDLNNVRYLVLDECHYLNDPERGTVWEESIIYSPEHVQILALSATIANSRELTDWISEVHGEAKLVETLHRPVPLRYFCFKDNELLPLFSSGRQLNSDLLKTKEPLRLTRKEKKHARKAKHTQQQAQARRSIAQDVVSNLNERGFLPAIYFVFSRDGCENTLEQCRGLGYSLLTQDERRVLADEIRQRIQGNDYLKNFKYISDLYRGMAIHHAGLLPQWKVIIEELFSKGLIKVVFATDTLALGINMPAKTTVISTLDRHIGNGHHMTLTSNDFHQIAGRAGRRGIDDIGNVVVIDTGKHSPLTVAQLVASKPDPLESRFTVNYSMVLNLLSLYKMSEIKELLDRCFGQYLRKTESYWDDFQRIVEVLTNSGYLKDTIPAQKGIMAASLRGDNSFLLGEILTHCDFSKLTPEEFAGCMSSLVLEKSNGECEAPRKISQAVGDIIYSIRRIGYEISVTQREHNIRAPIVIHPVLGPLFELWCKGNIHWSNIVQMTNIDEGDIVRVGRRTMDLLHQIQETPNTDPRIIDLAKKAHRLMDKEPLREVV